MAMAGFAKINFLWTLLTLPFGLVSLYLYLFKRKPKLDLKNKVVFISGASSGLGEACAEVFYASGCRVILSGRKRKCLEDVRDKLIQKKFGNASDPAVVVMDLENLEAIPAQMREALSVFGHIDVLVNNAGMSSRGLACDTSIEVYQKLMTVNLFGHIQVTKAVLPSMMERKSGHIVVVGSVQGLFAIPSRTAYAASKHAVTGYFDSLRAELSLHNIDVCVVSPYYIKTNLSKNAMTADGLRHGEIDKATEKGMDPNDTARKIVECVVNRTENKVISPLFIQLAICLRTMAPSIFYTLMARRAKKEQSAAKKSR